MARRMSRVTVLLTLTWMLFVAPAADAQDPPPRIGVFVIDLHASVPRFPSDATLADSRDMRLAELPGRGLGLQFGATVYPFRWRAVTFGIGGELTTSRARQDAVPAVGQTAA